MEGADDEVESCSTPRMTAALTTLIMEHQNILESPDGSKRKQTRVGKGSDTIREMLLKYFPVPITNVVLIHPFVSNPGFALLNRDSKVVQLVVDFVNRMLHGLSFAQLLEMIDLNEPVFPGLDHDHYGALRDSTRILKALLLFQFGDRDNVRERLSHDSARCH